MTDSGSLFLKVYKPLLSSSPQSFRIATVTAEHVHKENFITCGDVHGSCTEGLTEASDSESRDTQPFEGSSWEGCSRHHPLGLPSCSWSPVF